MRTYSTALRWPNRADADERGCVLARKRASAVFRRVKWERVNSVDFDEWCKAPGKRAKK